LADQVDVRGVGADAETITGLGGSSTQASEAARASVLESPERPASDPKLTTPPHDTNGRSSSGSAQRSVPVVTRLRLFESMRGSSIPRRISEGRVAVRTRGPALDRDREGSYGRTNGRLEMDDP
jgi:hypothetical protein